MPKKHPQVKKITGEKNVYKIIPKTQLTKTKNNPKIKIKSVVF
jgi:hypothetical protein